MVLNSKYDMTEPFSVSYMPEHEGNDLLKKPLLIRLFMDIYFDKYDNARIKQTFITSNR